MRATVLGSFLLALTGCPAPGPALRAPDSARAHEAPAPTLAPAPAQRACPTAQEWLARADERERVGLTDVANSYRGRAFAQEPGLARLFAWTDALVRGGEVRRARAALTAAHGAEPGGDAAWNYEVGKHLTALPASAEAPAPAIPDELEAARAAAAAGATAEAVAAAKRAVAREADPERLAAAGRLLWDLGDRDAARRAWTRARVRIDESGATTTLVGTRRSPSLVTYHHGRFLAVRGRGDAGSVVWDLRARRRLAVTHSPSETIMALAPDASHAAIRTRDGLEIRAVGTSEPIYRSRPRDPRFDRAQFVRGGVLLSQGLPPSAWFLEVPGGALRPLAAPIQGPSYAMSPDGRWLKTRDTDGTLQVWRATPGGDIHVLGAAVETSKFAADGSFVVLTKWDGPRTSPGASKHLRQPKRAGVLRLDGDGPTEGPAFMSDETFLELTPDGASVWIFDGADLLLRWRIDGGPDAVETFPIEVDTYNPRLVDTGTVLLLVAGDRVAIHARSGSLPRLATLRGLPSGGWVLYGEHGAIDGSEGAPDELTTQVHGPAGTLALDGRVAWDGAYVEDLLERTLAGEAAAAPMRPVSSPEEPGCASAGARG